MSNIKPYFYQKPEKFTGVNIYKIINTPLFIKGGYPPMYAFIFLLLMIGVVLAFFRLNGVIGMYPSIIGGFSSLIGLSIFAMRMGISGEEEIEKGEKDIVGSRASFKQMKKEVVDESVVMSSFLNIK